MSTDSNLEANWWERLSDKFSSATEGFIGFLGKIFGSSNDRLVKSLGFIRNKDGTHRIAPNSILEQVNSLEDEMKALSDAELKDLSTGFRDRLAAGETLEDILPEAFAACREAGRRTKNMRHFDVQIVGGVILHRGNITEMVTGEGKTLVATLPAYLNALTGKGVHVITVNDYLARRDCEWMSPIYNALGVSSGFIQSDMDPESRRISYEKDITYGTNSEFGFDYLRDNMKRARFGDSNYPIYEQQVQRALNFAIIDEVDNILIDEARTPLIISGAAHDDPDRYRQANRIAVLLTDLERKAQIKLKVAGHGLHIPGHNLGPNEEADEQAEAIQSTPKKDAIQEGETNEDDEDINVDKLLTPPDQEKKEKRLGYYFEVREKEHTCHLTDEGIRKAEELAGVESFYTAENMEWPHLIDNALKAHHLYQKDKRYVVMRHPETNQMSIILVDEFTGRLMIGRQLSDGLHQALEAKHEREGVQIREETQTLATVTLQNFFRLYKKLAGMTGTAMTEANEFWKIYKLEVVAIPTNRALVRQNLPDLVYLNEKDKWNAVVEEIEKMHKYDVVTLTDGAELVGAVKKETEETITFELKDGREVRELKEDEVEDIARKGRPILIGTTDVAKSEKISKLLGKRGVKHELLNAKPEYASREAEIVAQAGRIGAVTISTNMAGRGTDIILGGNAETLAWARLKDKYATRLDIPDDIWKQTVAEIRAKEKMEEEGRIVAEMGGLHIIGTERHESRRIDNQLRGRAGRQGDPGSGRFYVSLQDDLMRIFAGEWVANVLKRLGMEEGEAIESAMVTRRIEAAQKKVEERNFDIRKNLLEYDEVMDLQRKRVYGYRQEILEGANCRTRIFALIEKQVEAALERYLAVDYGPASFAEFAERKFGVEMEPRDYVHLNFADAVTVAKEKAQQMVATQVHELVDENLDPESEQRDWNYQALCNRAKSMWGLNLTAPQLRKMERTAITDLLLAGGAKTIDDVDLSEGKKFLDFDWGLQSLSTWVKTKFTLDMKFDAVEGEDPDRAAIRKRLLAEIYQLYRQKEIEFPVTVAMTRFMPEARVQGRPNFDRDGLIQWFKNRYPNDTSIKEEEIRTLSRSQIQQKLIEASKSAFMPIEAKAIDVKIAETFEGASVSEEGDAQELAEWLKAEAKVDVDVGLLTGIAPKEARNVIWNALDRKYRAEMSRVERGLLLDYLDRGWKSHLYDMDHLRQGIGLVGYAQIDPKTEYKRLGMKQFDEMWAGVGDKVTDVIFRLESDEVFQESVWSISATVKESAPSTYSQAEAAQAQTQAGEQQQAIQTSQSSDGKKQEPIRNKHDKIGRNDPCPCNSGKKYKNCCMRNAVK